MHMQLYDVHVHVHLMCTLQGCSNFSECEAMIKQNITMHVNESSKLHVHDMYM